MYLVVRGGLPEAFTGWLLPVLVLVGGVCWLMIWIFLVGSRGRGDGRPPPGAWSLLFALVAVAGVALGQGGVPPIHLGETSRQALHVPLVIGLVGAVGAHATLLIKARVSVSRSAAHTVRRQTPQRYWTGPPSRRVRQRGQQAITRSPARRLGRHPKRARQLRRRSRPGIARLGLLGLRRCDQVLGVAMDVLAGHRFSFVGGLLAWRGRRASSALLARSAGE